jgi:hypothetical protein
MRRARDGRADPKTRDNENFCTRNMVETPYDRVSSRCERLLMGKVEEGSLVCDKKLFDTS